MTINDPRNPIRDQMPPTAPMGPEGQPNMLRRRYDGEGGDARWAVAIVIAALIIGGAFWYFMSRDRATASNHPMETTGRFERAPSPRLTPIPKE